MENRIEINEYSMCIGELTNNIKTKYPEIYSLGILLACYMEVFNGFKVIRFTKPTEEGTWLTYKRFKNEEDLEEYIEDLRKKFKRFKNKYFKEDEEV